MNQRTRPRRSELTAQRRGEIIEAAIDLWATNGSRGTGITAVAERAGMTHAGLLHHFGSKNNLLLAVIAERDARDRALGQTFFEHDDIVALWPQWIEVARTNEAQPGLSRLFVVLLAESLDPTSVGHEYFRRRYQGLCEKIANLLDSAQQRGLVAPAVDPSQTACEIVAFMDGALVQWLMDPEPGALVRRYENFFGTLAAEIGLQQ